MVKHILCNSKGKLNSTMPNSNQKWNNEKCQCGYKYYRTFKKDYSWNRSICIWEVYNWDISGHFEILGHFWFKIVHKELCNMQYPAIVCYRRTLQQNVSRPLYCTTGVHFYNSSKGIGSFFFSSSDTLKSHHLLGCHATDINFLFNPFLNGFFSDLIFQAKCLIRITVSGSSSS